ncbi:MAG: ABC transporter substrate-binding protein [Thermomicrobiales bacterium]
MLEQPGYDSTTKAEDVMDDITRKAFALAGKADLYTAQTSNWHISRRQLLKTGAFAGAMFVAGSSTPGIVRTAVAQDTTPKPGGSVRMGIVADVQSFDPPIPGDNMSIWTMLNIYDQVVRVGKDGLSVDPCLAESWEISDDLLAYTFKIRQGVTFHDGTPLTAGDVAYCINRVALAEDSNWLTIFAAVESATASDDSTFVMKLKQPWAPMIADMALFGASIYPHAAHEAQGPALFEAPIGSGPFRFVSWQKGAEIQMAKYEGYWLAGQPYLDKVIFPIVADANTRVVQLQSGDMDIASDVPYTQIETLDAVENISVQVAPVGRVDYIAINHTREPFGDVNVRKAINLAIDKQVIIDVVLAGKGQVAQSGLPRMLDWNDTIQPYPYDMEQAKVLLAQSAVPDGFKTTLGVTAGDAEHTAIATIVKDQLAVVGIEIEIYEQESATLYVDKFQGLDYELVIQYHTTDIIDPSQITRYALAPRADGSGALWTGYVNERCNELAQAAQIEQDPEKRRAMYFEIQQITFDAAYIAYLYFPDSRTAVRSGIQGFEVLPTANYRMWEVWRDE